MFRTTFLCAGWIAATAFGAAAQDMTHWKNVGDWEISIDPTISNGCYALATWNGGTVLRIGLNPEHDNFYFLIGNDKWTSLKANEDYPLVIRFGSKPSWDVAARGLQFNPGETVYLHANSSHLEFLEEFMGQNTMKIMYKGKEIDTLKLTGSRKAFNEVVRCQENMDSRSSGGSDPFAN